jgi:hypothetical protein
MVLFLEKKKNNNSNLVYYCLFFSPPFANLFPIGFLTDGRRRLIKQGPSALRAMRFEGIYTRRHHLTEEEKINNNGFFFLLFFFETQTQKKQPKNNPKISNRLVWATATGPKLLSLRFSHGSV